MNATYCCKHSGRREKVAELKTLNGINYLEVVDAEEPDLNEKQRLLRIFFLHPPDAALQNQFSAAKEENARSVKITGGVRRTAIVVDWAKWAGGHLEVHVTPRGDFSAYLLHLVKPDTDEPLDELDPRLATVEFWFKVECPSEFDCLPQGPYPPAPSPEPEINYLAKDYASFRQLILDRFSLLAPEWRERHPADAHVALVELLAYVGDHLSYYQDAVATEAYLGTARKRISVRRHARLLDYFVHDGCNARAWVHLQTAADKVKVPAGTALYVGDAQPDQNRREDRIVFETMHDVTLYTAHNGISFYTWSDTECCLPKGAMRATLDGHFPNLKAGDVLIFEEIVGPDTGQPGDADPAHRQAVRLTAVYSVCFELTDDSLANLPAHGVPNPVVARLQVVKNKTFFREQDFLDAVQAQVGETQTARFKSILLQHAEHTLVDPLADGAAQLITEIEWSAEDKLTFPLCISSRTDAKHGEKYVPKVSVARGNIVLADHGLTAREDTLEEAPFRHGYRVTLKNAPLTQQGHARDAFDRLVLDANQHPVTFDAAAAACANMRWQMCDVWPAIHLMEGADIWYPQRDLLGSDRFARDFVAECDEEGRATLRFGDDTLGKVPPPGLKAVYRVGNGRAGNVGAGMINRIDPKMNYVGPVYNPLPAQGGMDPEPLEEVRQFAPQAFRVQERAVTEADWAEVAQRYPDVQKAVAQFRWTGSWLTVFVTIDRKGGLEVDEKFKQKMRTHLERYRLAGYDLEVNAPVLVPLDILLKVCAKPGHFRSEVKQRLMRVFSNRDLPDSTRGFFHPDNFTFGQPVYLSQIYRTAMAVDGVASVNVARFQRWDKEANQEIDQGYLMPASAEIVCLDNDPDFQERGKMDFEMCGGL